MYRFKSKPKAFRSAGERRVLLLARKLDRGGAERQLVTLARELKLLGHNISVLTFYADGALDEELQSTGVRLRSLGKRGRWGILGFLRRLAREVSLLDPEVIYSFLDTPNILAALLHLLDPSRRTVWTIRAAGMQMRHYDWLTRLLPKLEVKLSPLADLVVANSVSGRRWAISRGFSSEKIVVIENGIDTGRFMADPSARAMYRGEWAVNTSERLIGIVGRVDAMKDHENFLRAASKVVKANPEIKFVCVGRCDEISGLKLKRLSAELGLLENLIWVSETADVVGIYSSLDILCSASAFGEGFPNVVAEAMSCAVPCVVTDVGDSKRIVGEYGEVVEPSDPEALARGILCLLGKLDRNEAALKEKCRNRIISEFSLHLMVDRTVSVLIA